VVPCWRHPSTKRARSMTDHIAQMGPMLILAGLVAGWMAEAVSRAGGYQHPSRYGPRSHRKCRRGDGGLGPGLQRRRHAGNVPDRMRRRCAGDRPSAWPVALDPTRNMRTRRRSPTSWPSGAGVLTAMVVMSGGEVIARCQGCGAELQDRTQRFCGGDRCLLVLMRCSGSRGTPEARADSRFLA
jgi:hypothetical protein